MVEVFEANILNTKIVYKEEKLDWPTFVTPQSCDGGSFVVLLCFEAFAEEVISQDARLWQAVASTAYFKLYSAIFFPSMEVVFFDELGQDVGDLDAGVLRVLHWCVQVEVF